MIGPIDRAADAIYEAQAARNFEGWTDRDTDRQVAQAVFASIDPGDLAEEMLHRFGDHTDWDFLDVADAVIAHLTGKDQT